MDQKEREYMQHNLLELMNTTNCGVEMLAFLNNVSFSENEIQTVESKSIPQDKAKTMYETALKKANGYNLLARALQVTKQSGALKIILDGYKIMKKSIPDNLTCENVCFGEISAFWKQRTRFRWRGDVLTLEELLGENTSEEVYKNIYDELVKQKIIPSPAHHEIIELLSDNVKLPEKPKYYIKRTLSNRLELDPGIFVASKEHFFLFTGIDKIKLVELSGAAVEHSDDPLRDENVRFIILDSEIGYGVICKETTKPVHVIQHKLGKFFWVKSNKDLDFVREHLKMKEIHQISEETVASGVVSLSSPCSVCISDSPGMGKTFVLQNLARNIQHDDSRSIIVFIVLQEFLRQISSNSKDPDPVEVIAKYSASNTVTKLVLMEMMKTKKKSRTIYVFLDGYDEVYFKLDAVDSFLKFLQKVKSMKVIVTSRPHLKERMEKAVTQFSYDILPFDQSNQIEFLRTYWTNHNMYPANNTSDVLEEFAEICLKALQMNLTDQESEIAGIPLQCMMLAEVYASEAETASKRDVLLYKSVKPISLFEMYQKLIDFKFSRIPSGGIRNRIRTIFRYPRSRQKYVLAHVHEAIVLLFPRWLEEFNVILSDRKKVDETKLYNIGLLEKCANRSRFVHMTFAEYILAKFIFKNLNNHGVCTDLLFGEIHGQKEARIRGNNIELRYPVLAYFLNMHFGGFVKNHSIEKIEKLMLPEAHRAPTRFNLEDLCDTVVTCSRNDLEWTYEYTSMVLVLCFYEIPDATRDKFFKNLPHQVIDRLQKFKMVGKVLQFTSLKFNAGISYHILKEYKVYDTEGKHSWNIPDCSPLHLAVHYVNFNMVAEMKENYPEEIKKLKHLLHRCVFNSGESRVIANNILILKMLVKLNDSWLEERDHNQCTPLLQFNVHLDLLKTLVIDLRADINAYSSHAGTLLHRIGQGHGYKDILEWALANGFNLINHKDHKGRTPVMYASEFFEDFLKHDIPRIFQEAGADFNATDYRGNTILVYVIQHWFNWQESKRQPYLTKRDREDECTRMNPLFKLLSYFLQHGTDINMYSEDFGTFLHANVNMTMSEYTEIFRWAMRNGFKELNRSNRFMVSPLMHAIRMNGGVEDEVLEIFLSNGVDLNVNNDHGYSVLFYALCYSQDISFINKILDYGDNLDHNNSKGENFLHRLVGKDGCIENRVLMIDGLVDSNPGWLSKINVDGCTPLLQRIADTRILQRLVEHGADINAYSSEYGTVLHMPVKNISYTDLVCWAFSRGFKLVNHRNSSNLTPLMHALITYKGVRSEVIEMFGDAGTDFQAKDNHENTILDIGFQKRHNIEKHFHQFKLPSYSKRYTNPNTRVIYLHGRPTLEEVWARH